MDRKQLLERLALQLSRLDGNGPFIVGIDGVDGAGKTTLANELIPYIEKLNLKVARASIDGFHNPKEIRIAKGSLSPDGYFEDSFDYNFLINDFLIPIKKAKNAIVLKSVKHDWKTDSVVDDKSIRVDQQTIILFDGVFLFRPELVSFWDYKIYVLIDSDISLRRGLERDSDLLGGREMALEKYLKRYIPGQKIYHEKFNPISLANIVVQNENPYCPIILNEQYPW